MTDIVERLREWAAPFPTGVDAPLLGSDLHKAADEIERLRANLRRLTANPADYRYWEGRFRDQLQENDRLRASLQTFVTFHSGHVLPQELVDAMLLAREALGDGIERSGR